MKAGPVSTDPLSNRLIQGLLTVSCVGMRACPFTTTADIIFGAVKLSCLKACRKQGGLRGQRLPEHSSAERQHVHIHTALCAKTCLCWRLRQGSSRACAL